MRKKLWLGLGAMVAVATPIVAVVSCGKTQEPTDIDNEIYRRLKSSDALSFFEEKWAETVIKDRIDSSFNFGTLDADTARFTADVTTNATMMTITKFFIKDEISKDKTYLQSLAAKLQADQVATDADTDLQTLKQTFEHGVIYFEGDTVPSGATKAVTNKALNMILNYEKSNFKLKVYRQIIAENYLKSTNLDLFTKAFPREAKNNLLLPEQKLIDTNQYALVNAAISQKLFAKWNITLEATESNAFIGQTVASLSALQNLIKVDPATNAPVANADLAAAMKNSALKNRSFYTADDIFGADLNAFAGYTGISNMTAVGTKKLAFTEYSYKNLMTSSRIWDGVVQDNDLVTSGIKLVADNSKDAAGKAGQVNVTFVKGIMPVYANNKLSFENSSIKDKLDQVARLLAYKDSASIYSKASQFYRTELDDTHKKVVLTIPNDKIKELLQDANFEFIKERTAA